MAETTMPKIYDPRTVERALYDWWEAQGYFKPRPAEGRRPFVISMPPPNVTGKLHLGHAMTASVQDLMIRYHRMRGEPTLWVPGSDHAGIATQNVVERQLAKEGQTRHDLGREAFVARAWQWKEEYGGFITQQHRRLGVSCDWERERFTLDEGLSRAVREAFVRLYEKGLIYRGTYLVNWCPRCTTAISDLEVIHREEVTKLWHIKYPLEERPGEYVTVATTRPETMLGDTAVAVNPEDARYQGLTGQKLVLPLVGRVIPIIADDEVDPRFGTGAVKVTPAHDPVDYEMGKRHGLAAIDVMTDTGEMNEQAGAFAGQTQAEARRNVVAALEDQGLIAKIEDYRHAVGHCQRCDTLVEPRISTQWFVRMAPLAKPALEAVRDGRIRIIPERFEKVYFNWLENIRDWCISRQLWWGHRIPVWYCQGCGAEMVGLAEPTACTQCGGTALFQDPDVLDTWFSSGLWPFSTLGWPEDTEDLRTFYPTSVMETAYDILFFWVARMIMFGLEMTGEVPFHTVYLHGMVRDEYGQKMSKSKGNVVDPIEIMDEYGTDAMRFSFLTGSTPGNDMKLSLTRVEANRNFANKIWNAARFVVSNLEVGAGSPRPEAGSPRPEAGSPRPEAPETLADRWIQSRLQRVTADVTRLMDDYQFGEAGRQIYDFLWAEFADWYIEISKARLYGGDPAAAATARRVLVTALEQALRLLHPYMPFVTETIWQNLKRAWQADDWGEALMIAPWPTAGATDAEAERQMGAIMDAVRAIRNARAEYDVEPGRKIAALVAAGELAPAFEAERAALVGLAHLDDGQLTIARALPEKPAKALALVTDGVETYLPLAGMVDLEREQARLGKELESVQADIARAEGLLSNERFVAKAPADVVQKERDKLAAAQERKAALAARLELLAGM
ncbi:MAG TPA: valine--tRNA ligase [Anaerolineae bacterium]|nr:valine--tRNA ligase [Anaerolineae bacterium]